MALIARSVLLFGLCLATSPAPAPHHPHDVVGAIAISPGYPQDPTLFCSMAGTINLFLMSRDGGYTWRESRSGLRGSKISSVEFHPEWVRSGIAWVAMPDAGIQSTSDFGVTWQPASIRRAVIAMDVARASEGVALYLATYKELFLSKDGGKTDQAIPLPVRGAHIDSVSLSPTYAVDQTVAVTTSDSRILLSGDAGATWSETTLAKPARDVAFSPGFGVDKTIWAATWGDGVMSSTDGGRTFSPCASGMDDLFVNQLAVMRKGGSALAADDGGEVSSKFDYDLFASTKDHGVYRSVDSGLRHVRRALHLRRQRRPVARSQHQCDTQWPFDRGISVLRQGQDARSSRLWNARIDQQ